MIALVVRSQISRLDSQLGPNLSTSVFGRGPANDALEHEDTVMFVRSELAGHLVDLGLRPPPCIAAVVLLQNPACRLLIHFRMPLEPYDPAGL